MNCQHLSAAREGAPRGDPRSFRRSRSWSKTPGHSISKAPRVGGIWNPSVAIKNLSASQRMRMCHLWLAWLETGQTKLKTYLEHLDHLATMHSFTGKSTGIRHGCFPFMLVLYSNAINHPPVITIFMGGISTTKNGWFMTLLYPHYSMQLYV